MDLSNVSRDDWVIGGLALLLAIDLLFLPWFDVSASVGPVSVSVTSTATGAPDGWLGVLGVLAAIAVVADLALERLGTVELPNIGGSRASTRLVLVGATALFVALKFLFHVHFSLFGFGFWAGAVLAIALVVMALRAREDEGVATTAGVA